MKCRKTFFGVKEIPNEECGGFKENESSTSQAKK
jgi:hypothetical protein